jgi:hypothetical protein
MSAVLVELFDTAAPVLERVVQVVEAAKKAPEEYRTGLRRSLEAAETVLSPRAQEAMDLFQEFATEAVEGSEKANEAARRGPRSRGSSRAGATAPRPPPSNTGVTQQKHGKWNAAGKGKK